MKDEVLVGLERFFSEAKHPVLFAGAGVSAKAGLPGWQRLLFNLADAVEPKDSLTAQIMRKRIDEGSLAAAADYFFMSSIPDGDKYEHLKSQLSSPDARAIVDLVRLPFASVVTTNFDRCLFDAIAIAQGNSPEDFRYGDASFSAGAMVIQSFCRENPRCD